MKWTLALALTVAACGDSNHPGGAPDAPAATHDGSMQGSGKTVIFTILLENHDYAEIVGSPNAPYINSLIAMGGLATNYKDSGTHPSLPNYLYLISGDTQYPGFIDIDPTQVPYFPAGMPNLATQLEAANIKWRSYQESMPAPCALSGSGEYAPKHDPFLYFTDQQNGANNLCANTNVDYSQFAADLASNEYQYMWITPDLRDDGHDPQSDPVTGLKQSDAWLSQQVPMILQSTAYRQGGVLFITWDEAEGRNGDDPDQIPMIILSPRLQQAGMQVSTAYNHANYLATVQDLLGLPKLQKATDAASMKSDFLN